jgi:hypothetical protein|tara:strand:+ start:2976 stop:3164 length:189 start_codon:yes stop_codon:yes gene_type:complete
MNDIMIGIIAWIAIIAFMVWLYLFIKMVIMREHNIENKNFSTTTLDDTESIEYKHSVMASDE